MKQEEQNRETGNVGVENIESEANTLELMIEILGKLGCNHVVNEDGVLSMEFIGLRILMEFSAGFVRIWDRMWFSIENQDYLIPIVHFAVNDTNCCFGPTVILSDEDGGKRIGVNSRFDIAIHKDFPKNEHLVTIVFESFHNTREVFKENLRARLNIQMEAQKNRRPVGFTTNTQE